MSCPISGDESEATIRWIRSAEAALAPFAALATEDGRRPFKLDSTDPSTTEGRPIDDSTDNAQFAIRLCVGDVRRAAATLKD